MSSTPSRRIRWRHTFVFLLACWVSSTLTSQGQLQAQQRQHELFSTRMPAGEMGRMQVARRPELADVFQPVLLRVPATAAVALAEGDGFLLDEEGASLVSLQVGETYRLRVSNIPNLFGDVFPTVELVDRLHPPLGKETRFPIPIEITRQDLRLALSGRYVTRVIYVEDPQRALPSRDLPEQRYVDALAHEDPLHVAARVGRPVAILRMGSLAPSPRGPSPAFLFGAPPFLRHPAPLPATYQPSELQAEDMPPQPVPMPKTTEPAAEPAVDPTTPAPPTPDPNTEPAAEQTPPAEEISPNDLPSDPDDPFADPVTDDDADLFDAVESPAETEPEEDDPFADDI